MMMMIIMIMMTQRDPHHKKIVENFVIEFGWYAQTHTHIGHLFYNTIDIEKSWIVWN